MEEIYYFVSKNGNMKGFVNTKGQKPFLCDSRCRAAAEYIAKQKANSDREFAGEDAPCQPTEPARPEPVYIYTVKRLWAKPGENINGGYKSRRPFVITGCEKIENIYSYIKQTKQEKIYETDNGRKI